MDPRVSLISRQIANDIIQCNDALNEYDIMARLDEYLSNNDIEPNEELKGQIVDYMFSNDKRLGLDQTIGVDNQYYLVSISSLSKEGVNQ